MTEPHSQIVDIKLLDRKVGQKILKFKISGSRSPLTASSLSSGGSGNQKRLKR